MIDLVLLKKQTSAELVEEIEVLADQLGELIDKLNIEVSDEWVIVNFTLSEAALSYQFNRKTGKYEQWIMPLSVIPYFAKIISERDGMK